MKLNFFLISFLVAILAQPLWAEQAMSFRQIYNEARLFEMSKDWDNAEKSYEALVEQYPEQIETWFLFGRFLIERKRFEDSLPYFEKALELDPESEITNLYLAEVYIELGQPVKSLSYTERVRKIQIQSKTQVEPKS